MDLGGDVSSASPVAAGDDMTPLEPCASGTLVVFSGVTWTSARCRLNTPSVSTAGEVPPCLVSKLPELTALGC